MIFIGRSKRNLKNQGQNFLLERCVKNQTRESALRASIVSSRRLKTLKHEMLLGRRRWRLNVLSRLLVTVVISVVFLHLCQCP
jgi:hypothetical protein